jgi:rod shape determining protein RodA
MASGGGFSLPLPRRWLVPRGESRLVLVYVVLCLVSLATLWSVTEGLRGSYEGIDPGVPKSVFWRQVAWVVCGWFALVLGSRLSLRHLETLAIPTYLLTLLLLCVVLIIGPVVAGSHRWLQLGYLRLQPSELAKVGLILMLAKMLGRYRSEQRQLVPLLLSFLVATAPFLLVLREPDLGTSLVFLALWLGLIFWYGVTDFFLLLMGTALLSMVICFLAAHPLLGTPAVQEATQQGGKVSGHDLNRIWIWGAYVILLIVMLYRSRFRFAASAVILLVNLATGMATTFVYQRLEPYQQARLMSYIQPENDKLGYAYQAIQSKVAIGSGGLFGTHYLRGTQKGLAFLPERHTDFIFSVIGEELGFLLAVLLLGLFLVIILRAIELATEAEKPFRSYLAAGVATYFLFHVVVNVSITTGLLPVTGLPLPLISYGGSNLLVSSLLLGLLLNVSVHQREI